jgi:ribonuclease HI
MGFFLLWDLNIKDVWCYSDSRTAIKLIMEPVDEWHHYAAIIKNIKDILNRGWQVTLHHTLRKGNACTDFLAKHGANNNIVYSSITSPPVV